MNVAYNLLLLLFIWSMAEVSARGGRSGGGRGGSLGGSRAASANGAYSGGTKSRSRLPSSRNTFTTGGGASGGFLGGMRLWTFKTTGSIAQPSSRFQAYVAGATVGYLISRPSRTFYYSNNYYDVEPSDNVCEVIVSPDEIQGFNRSLTQWIQGDSSQEEPSVPVYFVCDGKCCEQDCCELNTGFVLFIVGCCFFTVIGVCFCCYCDNAKQPSAEDKEWFKGKHDRLLSLRALGGNPTVANRFAKSQSVCSTIYPPTSDLHASSSAAQLNVFESKELSDVSKSKLKISSVELETRYVA